MPYHNRVQRGNAVAFEQGIFGGPRELGDMPVQEAGHHHHHDHVADRENRDPNIVHCCNPHGCDLFNDDAINIEDPSDAVRVICNNDNCTMGQWMHNSCFQSWEQHVLAYLRSCGRARSWSEKQRLQNLWTKKGYDLAYKACDCKCGRGHLRKDLDYLPKVVHEEKRGKKGKKKNQEKNLPVLQKSSTGNLSGASVSNHASSGARPQLRVRTSSLSSTGSSPPSSVETPPLTPGGVPKKSPFEFFADAEQAAAGNIFRRRPDFSAFSILPRHQQNPYHIKMEDEGPYGNDETRCFVLSNLSTRQVTSVKCVVCDCRMPVFDRYPLIDGTFFLSPQRYNTDLQVLSDHRLVYMNAICMSCLEGARELRCFGCRRRWNGSTLVIGTMYSYDIFAAQPCCAARMACKNCYRTILDPSCPLQYFSEYSHSIVCPFCKKEDQHFVKRLDQCYSVTDVRRSICK